MTRIADSAQDILAISDLDRCLVYVKQWDMSVWVRALTLSEQDRIRDYSMKIPVGLTMKDVQTGKLDKAPFGLNATRALTVVCGAIREDGSQLFGPTDASKLASKSAGAVDTLFAKISELTNMSAEEIDELVGNSEAALGEDSSSGLPGTSDSLDESCEEKSPLASFPSGSY